MSDQKPPIKRSVTPLIKEFLPEKIILLSGPRQVGKTFLSKTLSKNYQYFNFDREEDRSLILKKQWVRNGQLVIFDEIHKMKKWKQWIKGIYDTENKKNTFLLTGSSRLDAFKKTGDSLAGRFISVRLNPFSLAELKPANRIQAAEKMLQLG
ncbi:MAG: AAA family ATPase, partial [Pseudobdellovibrionaceae bacterium]